MIPITASLVLFHNSKDEIRKVINSVETSSISELYVIDHSEDNSFQQYVENLSDKVIYIHSANKGYGAGHNVALKTISEKNHSKYHVVLNPDINFDGRIIDQLADYFDDNRTIGLLMPKVFYPNGKLQLLCKLLPTPKDILIRQFLPEAIRKRNDKKFTLQESGYNKIMNIPWLSGCFMFFRVEALLKVGFFDERYFMHFEDTDISRRIHEYYQTVYYPHVSIIHAHRAEHKKSLKVLRIAFISAVKYFNKWGWFYDKKRKEMNYCTLKELKLI